VPTKNIKGFVKIVCHKPFFRFYLIDIVKDSQ
jgi:hypothetical protein